jgi:hypothetical protein
LRKQKKLQKRLTKTHPDKTLKQLLRQQRAVPRKTLPNHKKIVTEKPNYELAVPLSCINSHLSFLVQGCRGYSEAENSKICTYKSIRV